ncbi:3-deoxy-7-phosphoheptulonate synthase [Streptomyces sp. NPDC058548]|uniref:3-deoxy-7-phosphoheptulonate synthase n=1 Tax=Streptomyces sp. NPDC058548 TaxID=3346545 RepID=UPI0036582AE1
MSYVTLLPQPVEELAGTFVDEGPGHIAGEGPGTAHAVREHPRAAPPLVTPAETELLSVRLAAVARGEAFLLQGGDSTGAATGDLQARLEADLRVLHQLGVALMYASGLPVVKTAQVCGPYPRPRRLAEGGIPMDHALSAAAMNLFRGLSRGEAPTLDRVHGWNTEFVRTAAGARHRALVDRIGRGLRFMAAGGFTDHTARTAEVYASRRMPTPGDERAMTPPGPEADLTTASMVGGSAHFLWLDAHTARAPASYADLVRRVPNPVGLRIGPDTTPAHAADLVERFDPHAVPGRLTLACSMGGRAVRDLLPPIVERVEATGRKVVWQCDPTHRDPLEFEGALDEVTGFVEVHRGLGTHPGGLRVETGGTRDSATGTPLTAPLAVELGFHTAELLGT